MKLSISSVRTRSIAGILTAPKPPLALESFQDGRSSTLPIGRVSSDKRVNRRGDRK